MAIRGGLVKGEPSVKMGRGSVRGRARFCFWVFRAVAAAGFNGDGPWRVSCAMTLLTASAISNLDTRLARPGAVLRAGGVSSRKAMPSIPRCTFGRRVARVGVSWAWTLFAGEVKEL